MKLIMVFVLYKTGVSQPHLVQVFTMEQSKKALYSNNYHGTHLMQNWRLNFDLHNNEYHLATTSCVAVALIDEVIFMSVVKWPDNHNQGVSIFL